MRMMTALSRSLVVLLLSACGVGPSMTSPVATTGETTSSGTSSTTGDASTTSGAELDPSPWYGPWYAFSQQFAVNVPASWANGGSSFGFDLLELRSDGATIQTESCLWGPHTFEYRWHVAEDGVLELEPVGGVHEFEPHGAIERLFVELGNDCNSLFVRQIGEAEVEVDFLTPQGDPLLRGELCLAQCAEAEGEQGIISDCGVEVPWKCE